MPHKTASERHINIYGSIISGVNREYLNRFAKLVANSYDGITLMNKDFQIVYRSPSAERITGWSATERTRYDMGYLVNSDDIEQLASTLEDLLNSPGESKKSTYRTLHADGHYIWVESTFTNYLDDADIGAIVCNFRDITEQKQGKDKQTLSALLKEKETILESIDDAFFAMDENWTVTYWNRKAEQVSGHLKDKVVGRNIWDTYPELKGSAYEKGYHQAAKTQKAVRFEAYYAKMNRWHEVNVYPAEKGLSVYFKVINERKEAELHLKGLNESLEKQAKELALSNAELEQFAYVASHDLQEPLRMVTSFLTQLEKKYSGVIDEKGRQYIYFAVDGAKRMRQIILDLLDFSRIGRTEDDLEEVDLNQLVGEIAILYHRQIQELKATLEYKDLPKLTTYKTPVRQVFQNLIGNSLKYHSTDRKPLISITAKETAGQVEIAVRDNGIGVAKEYFEKIFIIFQRLHHKEQYSGTGMGLAIAKKIIENMGGRIWVESEEGNGSTFHFILLKMN